MRPLTLDTTSALLLRLFDLWLDKQASACRKWTGHAVGDLVTVAHVLGWTEPKEHSRARLREDLTFDVADSGGTLRWMTDMDGSKLDHGWQRSELERTPDP